MKLSRLISAATIQALPCECSIFLGTRPPHAGSGGAYDVEATANGVESGLGLCCCCGWTRAGRQNSMLVGTVASRLMSGWAGPQSSSMQAATSAHAARSGARSSQANSSWLISGEMAPSLTQDLFPRQEPLHPPTSKAPGHKHLLHPCQVPVPGRQNDSGS